MDGVFERLGETIFCLLPQVTMGAAMRWRDKRRRVQKRVVHASGLAVSERPPYSAFSGVRERCKATGPQGARLHPTKFNRPVMIFFSPKSLCVLKLFHTGSAPSRRLAFRLLLSRWSCPRSTLTSLLTRLYGATELHNNSMGANGQ